jgi:Zn-dependent protease
MLLELLSGGISFASFAFGLVALIIAIDVHEFSHARAALALGDPTAKLSGRLTLNPVAHLDQVGTLMLLLFGFGWGKPVPINPVQMRKGRFGVALVSLAGPLSNLVMAVLVGLMLRFNIINPNAQIYQLVNIFVQLNIGLMLFNLLPLGPLDGYKIALGLLPPKYAYRLTQIGSSGQMMIIWLLVAVLIFPHIFNLVLQLFYSLVVGVNIGS